MKTNKLKSISISIFCFVTALWTETQGMDDIQANVPYKIENMWHKYQGEPSYLDAASNNSDGLIYRSGFDNDNTSWYLIRMTDGSYKIENKWHKDQGEPSYLDAASNNSDGLIYRSGFGSDNTSWYLNHMPDGSYKIENKWHKDQGKPSYLDADSKNSDGLIYRSDFGGTINTSWYLTRKENVFYKFLYNPTIKICRCIGNNPYIGAAIGTVSTITIGVIGYHLKKNPSGAFEFLKYLMNSTQFN